MAVVEEEITIEGKIRTEMTEFVPEDPACLCYERLTERTRAFGVEVEHIESDVGESTHTHGGVRHRH